MRIRMLAWLTGLIAFAAAPLAMSDYTLYLVSLIAANGVVALGLTIVTGAAGQISLAQAAFSAIGGYGVVLLGERLGVPAPVGIPLAGLLAAALGYLLGLPALRLEGPYLALVTLAFTAIVQQILIHRSDLTNGQLGLQVPPLTLGARQLTSSRDLYLVTVPVAALMFFIAARVLDSRIGRAFQALRQSEVAAQVLGVNLVRYKTLAFALSAFYGGIGGGLLALLTTFLSPDSFGITDSIFYLVIMVVGGVGAVWGALLGSALLTLLPEVLNVFKYYQALVYGVLLLTFVVFIPGGITSMVTWFRDAFVARARIGLSRSP